MEIHAKSLLPRARSDPERRERKSQGVFSVNVYGNLKILGWAIVLKSRELPAGGDGGCGGSEWKAD